MAITCKIHTTELDDNAVVLGEYDFRTAQHKHTRTLNGSLVIESYDRVLGENIALVNLWLTKSTLDTIATLADDSDATYTLTLPDATTKSVMFDCSEGKFPIKAEPIFNNSKPVAGDKYDVQLFFIEVA